MIYQCCFSTDLTNYIFNLKNVKKSDDINVEKISKVLIQSIIDENSYLDEYSGELFGIGLGSVEPNVFLMRIALFKKSLLSIGIILDKTRSVNLSVRLRKLKFLDPLIVCKTNKLSKGFNLKL